MTDCSTSYAKHSRHCDSEDQRRPLRPPLSFRCTPFSFSVTPHCAGSPLPNSHFVETHQRTSLLLRRNPCDKHVHTCRVQVEVWTLAHCAYGPTPSNYGIRRCVNSRQRLPSLNRRRAHLPSS